ncbi:MAG TPA: hypothetical protein ENG05_00950 [Acidilobales archaeon]|nr:hypothetical protein [Acidilobales archaeon]
MSLSRSPVQVLARILEILAENGGIIRDNELFEILRREYDISLSDLMKYLMLLEMRGYISVSSSSENVRIIHLTRYGKEQLRLR